MNWKDFLFEKLRFGDGEFGTIVVFEYIANLETEKLEGFV
jgi:hypothetical protein